MGNILILKNLFKIKIHPFFYIFMFASLITGNFWNYIIFTSIIVVHEFGHIFAGILFSWKIKKIIILPFGGITIFNNLINTSLFEQIIVTLSGPIFQIIYFNLIKNSLNLESTITYYNYILLFFNLLPIYPLDGSKIIYVILCYFFPFKLAHIMLLIISFTTCIICIIMHNNFNLIFYLIILFLIIKLIEESLKHKYIYNKFLFERYLYNLKFNKVKYVKNEYKMFLWCRHVFLSEKCITEKQFLSEMFDNKSHLW